MHPDSLVGFDAYKNGQSRLPPVLWLPHRRKLWLIGWDAAMNNAKIAKLRPIWTEADIDGAKRL